MISATLTKLLSLTETWPHPHPFYLGGQKKKIKKLRQSVMNQDDKQIIISDNNLGEVQLTSQSGDSPCL